ncbi:hypothetical protein LCGC14_2174630 [marine sediment metagenome]|uniref:Uncharacterized protein n=1 Tax=marine sediment metagenome TaxID=412755 RepID=A0A0F9DP39_9ZZZZ
MQIRRNENYRESWYVTNRSKQKISIGDLPSAPVIRPGKRVDLLKFYTREKVSHSKVLATLVKSRILIFNKEKTFSDKLPGCVSVVDMDKAITPAEENEIYEIVGDFVDKSLVTEVGDPGTDNNVVTEQGIREALIDEVTSGQEITDDTGGILLHGKDPDNAAQPVGISGEENNKVQIMNLDIEKLLEDIYIELIKANIQMAIITGNEIKNRDIISL